MSAMREPPYSDVDGVVLARTRFTKRFHGGLDATSTVEMLGATNAADSTSAGYVAIERIEGALHGRTGSFVLQHSGVMDRGEYRLACTVVPGSGTGELAGLRGALAIGFDGPTHHYRFDYTLDAG